ncbi:MAG: hypothetical protein HKN19_15640 [Halioglobus sp.]|nr:hypothetical protein [Halioglobus sp.]
MNRCRALVAQQARAFAEQGYLCTLVDFFGTGDCDGDLVDATLAQWRDNLERTIETLLAEQDLPLVLWGLRLGALIALDYAAQSDRTVRDIVLWQPVTSGKIYINQVLRQRVASLMVRDLPPETTKEIRQRLADGEHVEIAGYTLAGALAADIEAIDTSRFTGLCSGTLHWLEHVVEEGKDIGIPSRKLVDQLGESHTVNVQTFNDPPIWQIHERDEAPQLLALSRELLA